MNLPLMHAAAACAWIGLVAGETVLELHARDASARRVIADVHRWIDVLFEIPLVILVLVSGGLLLWESWPVSPLLLLKAGAGLVGIGANVVCIPLVRARHRATEDERIGALTRQIRLTGIGIPFAVAALLIGLYVAQPN